MRKSASPSSVTFPISFSLLLYLSLSLVYYAPLLCTFRLDASLTATPANYILLLFIKHLVSTSVLLITLYKYVNTLRLNMCIQSMSCSQNTMLTEYN